MATQYLIGEDGAALPEGIVLAHTLYGEPHTGVTHAHTAVAAHGVAVIPVGEDGIAYVDPSVVQLVPVEDTPVEPEPEPEPEEPQPLQPLPNEPFQAEPGATAPVDENDLRAKRCTAKNNTCMGWRIKDSELCAAHAGVWRNPLGRPRKADT